MRILLLLAASAILLTVGCNRKLPTNPDNARLLFEKSHYAEADKMYRKLLDKSKTNVDRRDNLLQLISTNQKMSRYGQAAGYLKQLSLLEPQEPYHLYNYARMLKCTEQYELALENFRAFKQEVPGHPRINEQIAKCKEAIELRGADSKYEVSPMAELNSADNEYCVNADANGFFFTSDRLGSTGEGVFPWLGTRYTDIFYAKNLNDKLLGAQPISANINTDKNEGVSTLSEDSRTLFFTQCHGPGKDSSCTIMMVTRQRGVWGEPTVFPPCDDPEYNFGHPSISPDGKSLFFSSNRPGGVGGHDIWVSRLQNGRWQSPENLGPKVNTTADEMYPHAFNNKTLYFSSNGWVGYGALDIFLTEMGEDGWKKARHQRPPLNSGGDDFGLSFDPADRDKAYISSNRPGSQKDDIYSVSIKSLPPSFVRGSVYNKKTGKKMRNAKVSLVNQANETSISINTNDTGGYEFELAYEKVYRLDAFKRYYVQVGEGTRVSTKGLSFTKTFKRDLYLDKWMITETTIEGIYYDLNKATIRQDAKPVLDSVSRTLKKHGYLVIQLASHTDCRADSGYNLNLSQRRAESVVNYLVNDGINVDRLVAKGYGENRLVNNCECEGETESPCTEEEHQANRRTTFRILRTDFKEK